jgi:hypothetical protein
VLDSRESGFEFLGFTFRWQRSSKGTDYVHTEPSRKSRLRLQQRLREMTPRHSTWRSATSMVNEINVSVRGWGNYFAHCHYGKVFNSMQRFTNQRMRNWLWKKQGQRDSKYQRWSDATLAQQYRLYQLPGAQLGAGSGSDKGTRKAGCGKTARPV